MNYSWLPLLTFIFSSGNALDEEDIVIGKLNAALGSSGWHAGRTSLIGTPEEQRKLLTGARIPSLETAMKDPYILPYPTSSRDRLGVSLPATFDARLQWPKCTSIGEIRNQGKCAACWAFSGVSVITDRICIHGPGQNTIKKISVQDAIVCASDADSTSNLCSNWYTVSPMRTFVERGLVSGGEWNQLDSGCMPYTSFFKENIPKTNIKECTRKCTNRNHSLPYEKDKTFGSIYYSMGRLMGRASGGAALQVQNESAVTQIMVEIMKNGPVSALLDVYSDFFYYVSGVYEHKFGTYVGGHSMKIIGWGRENGKEYWLGVNSWGTGWGMHGAVKLLKGVDHLKIEHYVTTALPKKVTKATSKSQNFVFEESDSGLFVPPLANRPDAYDRCDGLFCLEKPNGYHPVYPCSRNYCHCHEGQATSYGCPPGHFFSTNSSCQPLNSNCHQKSKSINAEVESKCNAVNCRGRDRGRDSTIWGRDNTTWGRDSTTWFPLGLCSPLWCFCWADTQAVQKCPDGQLFDFRPENARCTPKAQLQWCS